GRRAHDPPRRPRSPAHWQRTLRPPASPNRAMRESETTCRPYRKRCRWAKRSGMRVRRRRRADSPANADRRGDEEAANKSNSDGAEDDHDEAAGAHGLHPPRNLEEDPRDRARSTGQVASGWTVPSGIVRAVHEQDGCHSPSPSPVLPAFTSARIFISFAACPIGIGSQARTPRVHRITPSPLLSRVRISAPSPGGNPSGVVGKATYIPCRKWN